MVFFRCDGRQILPYKSIEIILHGWSMERQNCDREEPKMSHDLLIRDNRGKMLECIL